MPIAPGLNFYALNLLRLEHAFDDYVVNGSLAAFSEAIARTTAAIHRAQAEGDDAYQDFFLDNDLDLIETHLGCAFVTCQVFLTAVVSRVKALHDIHRQSDAAPLITTSDSKASILQFGSAPVGGSPYSQMQAVDAFANYFKHRDCWDSPWSRLAGQAAHTVAVITALGAGEASSGNLRTGAAAICNEAYTDVERYGALILAWKDTVCAAYRAELRTRGLVQ